MVLRADLDFELKIKIPSPLENLRAVVQSVAILFVYLFRFVSVTTVSDTQNIV